MHQAIDNSNIRTASTQIHREFINYERTRVLMVLLEDLSVYGSSDIDISHLLVTIATTLEAL